MQPPQTPSWPFVHKSRCLVHHWPIQACPIAPTSQVDLVDDLAPPFIHTHKCQAAFHIDIRLTPTGVGVFVPQPFHLLSRLDRQCIHVPFFPAQRPYAARRWRARRPPFGQRASGRINSAHGLRPVDRQATTHHIRVCTMI